MNISKETTLIRVDKTKRALKTSVPILLVEILDLHAGDKLEWVLSDDGVKINIKKQEKQEN